jgi:hypothetical protein
MAGTAIPWPELLEHIGSSITHASLTARAAPRAHTTGDDDFRARLWEEGYVLDALDSVSQWYFAIVIKTRRESNEIRIHYDGWPPKYDEWIDASQ